MKRGFTLAEVLIVLGIIGIIAALTLPTLIANHKEKETVVKLKKIYNTLSQAFLLAINENGSPDDWELDTANSTQGAMNVMDKFAPYLNIIKNCGNGLGCWHKGATLNLSGAVQRNFNSDVGFIKSILSDGTMMAVRVLDENCVLSYGPNELSKICGDFFIDINGEKLPNTIGKDVFTFYYTKDRIIPYGTKDDISRPFPGTCRSIYDGRGCTAWVIFNENQGYLKCNDLSWDGKTKCE